MKLNVVFIVIALAAGVLYVLTRMEIVSLW